MSKSKTSNNLSISYPTKLVREHTGKNGHIFHSLSFMFKDRWASFIVNEDRIKPVTLSNGDVVDGKVSVELGEASDITMVSLPNDDGLSFRRQPFFNSSIAECIHQNKQDYLRSIAI